MPRRFPGDADVERRIRAPAEQFLRS
ncbi:hypothetical protein LINPERHAP2_LOCUS29747 [Linum perenne]